jgi:hypothetical protein
MVLLFAALTSVGAVTTKGQCVDAAREGALAASRGEPAEQAAARVAPPGSEITAYLDAETVTVTIRAEITILGGHLPKIMVRSTAVAAREPQPVGGAA